MNLVMYLLVVALTNKPVMGEGIESIESYNCTKLLADAGCDDKGHLLDKYACLNSNYRQFKPPNSFTTVNIGWFLDMPKILDVKEKMGTIKIGLDETIFFWEDPRIKINFDNIENEKLHRVPLEPSDKFVLSIFPYNDICNPDTNENSNFKMWTPINQRINIHGELSREAEGSESLWGIQDYGLRFTEPLNESNPLMHMRMKLKVTIRCEFEHVGYPMDTQKCSLRIYSHRMQPLNIFFYDLSGICNEPEPTYERNGFLISSSCVNQTDGQNEIGIDFSLKRSINKYLFQYYLPSAIIVIVSQTSFFIPLSAIPGRIGLVVTQFLALTNIFINEQSDSLANNRFTASGAYILICLTFVVATMFQLTALLIVKQRSEEKIVSLINKDTKSSNIDSLTLIKKIDKICTLIFPLSFLIFNVIYWSCML